MDEEDIRKVLTVILNLINGKKFIWRVEGSANLKIQGVNTSVRDLDFTTNDGGIAIFREALKKHIVKDFFNQKIKGHSIVCNILGFEVEINSYGDRKLNMFDKSKKITWKELQISVLPLKYAKIFYELINRKEKIELIKKYLDN